MIWILRPSALPLLAGWVLLSGLTGSPASAELFTPRSPAKVTELLVLESSGFQINRFVVTTDSIRVSKGGNLPEDPQMRYARALTRRERDHLLAPLDQLYLSRLRPTYEGPSDITDGYSYDFSIRKGEYLKETRLDSYALAPLLTSTHRLNALLPTSFRLSYGKP